MSEEADARLHSKIAMMERGYYRIGSALDLNPDNHINPVKPSFHAKTARPEWNAQLIDKTGKELKDVKGHEDLFWRRLKSKVV